MVKFAGFLDCDEAIAEIMGNLRNIDDGDHSSLPWMLQALTVLSRQENAAAFRPHVAAVLPLVCNGKCIFQYLFLRTAVVCAVFFWMLQVALRTLARQGLIMCLLFP